jgi:two-component system, OmpR family, response regulator
MRVLVCEDEDLMAELVGQALTEEGHDVEVVASGERAIDAVMQNAYDLVLLDVMLPGLDGFATCRRLRDRGSGVPVLMLTARDDVDDRVRGLDSGADDYLGKPFSLAELLARVRALLRRGPADFGGRIAVGDLELDTAASTVRRAGSRIDLTVRELAVLELLMREHGRVVSRDQILENAWPRGADHRSNVIDVIVGRLRDKIDRPFNAASIETVRGRGYRLRIE